MEGARRRRVLLENADADGLGGAGARGTRVFRRGAPHLASRSSPRCSNDRGRDRRRIADDLPRRGGYTLGDDEAPGPESFESFESTSRFRQTPGGPARPEALADPGPETAALRRPTRGREGGRVRVRRRPGSPARWLRALGFDAEHVPAEPGVSGRVQHATLLRLAERERRVILTRDAG